MFRTKILEGNKSKYITFPQVSSEIHRNQCQLCSYLRCWKIRALMHQAWKKGSELAPCMENSRSMVILIPSQVLLPSPLCLILILTVQRSSYLLRSQGPELVKTSLQFAHSAQQSTKAVCGSGPPALVFLSTRTAALQLLGLLCTPGRARVY